MGTVTLSQSHCQTTPVVSHNTLLHIYSYTATLLQPLLHLHSYTVTLHRLSQTHTPPHRRTHRHSMTPTPPSMEETSPSSSPSPSISSSILSWLTTSINGLIILVTLSIITPMLIYIIFIKCIRWKRGRNKDSN